MVLAHKRIRSGTGHEEGRKLLAQLYLQHTGRAMPPVLTGPWGKPYFAEGSVHFSITHTKHHVFCLLSDRPVGIDAEELTRQVRPALAEKILSPMEKEQYDLAEDKNKTLLTFWVLKEAAGKRTGQGLRGYPNHTEFLLPDARVQEMEDCLVAVMEE